MASIHPDKAMPTVGSVSRLSWGAVFGGTALAITTLMLMVLLGMAIGFFALNVATEENPLGGMGVGSYIWWVLSWIVALFIGGCVTSRFAGLQRTNDGMLHGLVTWALTTLVILMLLTNIIGTVVGGAFSVAKSALGAAGQAVSALPGPTQVIPGQQNPVQTIMQEAQQTIEQVRQKGGEQAVNELTNAIREVFSDAEITQADQQRLADLLGKYTDMSQQEAQSTVSRWVSSFQQAKQQLGQVGQQVAQTAEDVAQALGQAAIWAFLALLLGALAAGLGGRAGRVGGAVSI
ncbi:MAG: hypothetical protein R6W92_08695 [Desulfocurvibacter africanus]